jgi:YD repeat-containing protein
VPARCNITYRPNGPIASMLYGDGFTQTRSYDNSYRLTGVTDSLAASLLRQLTYGYEGRDNLTSITDAQVPANNEVFGYTPRESVTLATGPYGSLAFTYDGVGNRVTAAANPGSGLVTDTYSYPATSNRLTSIAQGAGGTRAFTYDAAGNVTFDNRTGGGYGYTYDAAGRMASLTINGVLQAEYKYDFAGRQAVRRLPQLGVTLHSVFDAQGSRAGFSPQPPSHRKSPPQRHTNVRT